MSPGEKENMINGQIEKRTDKRIDREKQKGNAGQSWRGRETRRAEMNFKDLFRKNTKVESKKSGKTTEEERICQLEQQLEDAKKRDRLTGALNRVAFMDCMEEMIRNENKPKPGLILIDVDGMKTINNRYGYSTGDFMLKEMAGLLEYCAPEHSVLGRLEGDIFAIFISNADPSVMSEVGNRILFSVRELKAENMGIGDGYYQIRVSLGSSLWDAKAKFESNAILQQASAALLEAKVNGRNQQIEFSENQALFLKMQVKRQAKMEIELGMRGALERGEFYPVFQPQYDISSNTVVGLEMLDRWNHPQKGTLYPSYYMSTFEENRFIIELDLYMYEKACMVLSQWMKEKRPMVPISCNFSGLHCFNPFWAAQLNQIAKKYEVSPTYLRIEVGEKALMEEPEKMSNQIAALREYGFLVCLQGFGAGFSSIGILQNTPVDDIMIDRSIVVNDFSQENNRMIFAGILAIADMLKIRVCCMGIETKKQEEILKKQGCFLAQGNYYCSPVSLPEVEALLLKNSREVEKKKREDYSINQGREFLETILDDYYVKKNIDRVEEMVTENVEWKDIFTDRELKGKSAWKASFQKQMGDRTLHMNLNLCVAYPENDNRLVIHGEGSFQEQESGKMKDMRFCFYADCVETGGFLRLSQLRMVPLSGNKLGSMKELEDAIKESNDIRKGNALLDSLYGKLPVGIMRMDMEIDMLVTYINEEMFHILGYTREEIFGDEIKGNFRSLVHPEDVERHYKHSCNLLMNGGSEPIEIRYIQKNGTIVTVRQHQYNLVGVSGRGEVQVISYPISWQDKE
jgi:diguanylate cyclase (GGDEF)-like protein